MSKECNWLDSAKLVEGTFPEDYEGPVYDTPDWVRHPERYPELVERLKEFGKVWQEGLKKQ